MDTIPVLYEDEDLVIVDKPAGITVNRAETTKNEMTIQDWAEEKLSVISTSRRIARNDIGGSDFYNRGGVVHRLDKETSGVLILAKNPQAFIDLQKQFKDRTVKKTYIALSHGKVFPEAGEINVPVGRLPWNRKSFGIIPGGRESKTNYKVIKYYQNPKNKEIMTLLELYPQTGRTHQIRVHLKYIGHPVFSDFLYAGRKTARNDRKILSRVFLHAGKISFIHPVTGKTVTYESHLSQDLSGFLTTALHIL